MGEKPKSAAGQKKQLEGMQTAFETLAKLDPHVLKRVEKQLGPVIADKYDFHQKKGELWLIAENPATIEADVKRLNDWGKSLKVLSDSNTERSLTEAYKDELPFHVMKERITPESAKTTNDFLKGREVFLKFEKHATDNVIVVKRDIRAKSERGKSALFR
jgi:hypothetical protein